MERGCIVNINFFWILNRKYLKQILNTKRKKKIYVKLFVQQLRTIMCCYMLHIMFTWDDLTLCYNSVKNTFIVSNVLCNLWLFVSNIDACIE